MLHQETEMYDTHKLVFAIAWGQSTNSHHYHNKGTTNSDDDGGTPDGWQINLVRG